MNFSAKIVALVVLATSVVAQTPNCARDYTVKFGDDCDSISAAMNVSTFQLANVNADKVNAACDNLVLGETLCLGIVGQDCNVTTVVESGDTCFGIATKADVDLSLLLHNNPNINPECTNIYPGEVLCAADEVFVQS